MLGVLSELRRYDSLPAGPFAVYLPVPLTVEEEERIYNDLELVTVLRTSSEPAQTEFLNVGTESTPAIVLNNVEDGDLAAVEQMRNEGEEYD